MRGEFFELAESFSEEEQGASVDVSANGERVLASVYKAVLVMRLLIFP